MFVFNGGGFLTKITVSISIPKPPFSLFQITTIFCCRPNLLYSLLPLYAEIVIHRGDVTVTDSRHGENLVNVCKVPKNATFSTRMYETIQ